MADLQKPLRGYADFIGRYTGGQVNLSDSTVLAPVIQMDDFLNERKNIAFDFNFTSQDQVAGVSVPEGKQWLVHFVSVYHSANAGEQTRLELHWRRVFGGAIRYYPLGTNVLATNLTQFYQQGAGQTAGYCVEPKIIIPSGDGLGVSTVAVNPDPGNFATRWICQVTEFAL